MPEYIEREALKAEIRRQMDDCKPMSEGRFYGASFLATVDLAPAADVETVRHGQWIAMHYEGGILDGTDVDKCSKCGAERVIEEPKYKTKYNYCPNCGAKMDGKRKEAT